MSFAQKCSSEHCSRDEGNHELTNLVEAERQRRGNELLN